MFVKHMIFIKSRVQREHGSTIYGYRISSDLSTPPPPHPLSTDHDEVLGILSLLRVKRKVTPYFKKAF